jgi:hypothetical protein
LKYFRYAGFQILTEEGVKITIFRDTALCSLSGADRRFREPYYLHHQGDEKAALGLLIVLMMEAVRTSKRSVYFNESTRHYVQEDCQHH